MKLGWPQHIFIAKTIYDKYPNQNHNIEANFPIVEKLQLKKGALIMMVANDSEHRWVNGTLGTVSKLSQNRISVEIGKRTYEVLPETFAEREVIYDNGEITYEDIWKVEQYPIVPAYAITIHKSQGQTYQNVVCDIGRCFATGQAYVALSRCTSMDGLYLRSTVNPASIRVDGTVLDFYRGQTNIITSDREKV